ncbi:MAG: hypothetical protein LUP97_01160 [Methanoregula sp.]|nr:hypothetical protein [Methanoregula sp.]
MDITGFGMNAWEFARYLVEEVGVAAVPKSSFPHQGGETKLRFTFTKKDETLVEASNRLERIER